MDKSALEALIEWLEFWSWIFGVVVAIGVAGESVFGIRLLWNNWKLQGIQNAETAEAKRRQADAELRLEQLKKQVAWRHIRADEFLKVLQGSPKPTIVKILYLRDDPECWSLAMEFLDVLTKAHWPVGFPEPIKPNEALPFSMLPTTASIGASPTGISVEANAFTFPTWDDKSAFGFLTNAIVDSLGGVSPRENKSLPDRVFRIIVGPKEGRFFR